MVLASELAVFAGGCFWCTQADLSKIKGIVSTVAGFDGGVKKSPSYYQVASGKTRYVESVFVKFNPKIISYKELVNKFLRTVDVTQANGQFCDKGAQYRSVIFYLNDQQKQAALEELARIKPNFKRIYTQVLPHTNFYAAENYHQHYAKKNKIRYKYYRWRCGRDQQLKKIWQHEAKH
jgi:peptide-methionine (S)-S-oxide reductase